MEGSEISLVGVERGMQDMLHDSQSRDIVQHHGSNPGGTSEAHPVEEDEGSILVTQNPSLVSPVCCPQEVGVEPPGPEAGRDPCDSQQDLECNSNEEKTLGKEVLILMEALSTLPTPEEKLAVLCMKYADLLEDSSNVQKEMKILQKKQVQIVKEKDHLQSEHSKAILSRSKLEYLCRELQQYNETLKEENMQQARAEEESCRKATSHFQFTLKEIQARLEQHGRRRTNLQRENMELAENLRKLIEQYTMREEHIDEVLKHKELQQQFMEARLHQTTQLMKEADEKHQRQKELLFREATELKHRCEEMRHQEAQLKQQLSVYMDKFQEFQTTMAESNELFTTFRLDMEKMTEKIEKLEKEMVMWRTKWESNNKVLLEMAEEKSVRDEKYRMAAVKRERLQKLFRDVQQHRNKLNEEVKVLKEQVSTKAAGVNTVTRGTQPSTASDPQEELNTSSQEGQEPSCSLSPSE